MTVATLEVSVVICAYTEERWSDLIDAVASVQQQSVPPYEVIIVIDHNLSLFTRAQTHLSGVVVIENSASKGLSGARNSGIAASQGEFIAFLDDDAVAESDWLKRLSDCCQDPQVLGAGGIVYPRWSDSCPAWFPEEFYWVVGCTYEKPPKKPMVVRNPYGGCTCIRREVFDAVGGFTSGIGRIGTRPMGGEETELCIRARQFWPQKVFLYDPEAKIHHRIPARRGRWSYFCSRCFFEGFSKAVITRCVGVKDGLASERSYTLKTLPLGVLAGIHEGLFHLKLAGFLRAGAIISGLLVTIAGYITGSLFYRFHLVQEESTKYIHRFKPLSHIPN